MLRVLEPAWEKGMWQDRKPEAEFDKEIVSSVEFFH